MEKIMTSLTEDLKSSASDSLRSAVRDYFAPAIGIRRFLQSLGRVPLLIKQEEEALLALKKMQQLQEKELRTLTLATKEAVRELSRIRTKIEQTKDFGGLSGRLERTGRNPRTYKTAKIHTKTRTVELKKEKVGFASDFMRHRPYVFVDDSE
jgi:nucleoid DNA-binding protein